MDEIARAYLFWLAVSLAVFITIVHFIGKFFGLRLKFQSLVLACVLGVGLAFLLVTTNKTVDGKFFLEIAVGVLGIAGLATLYNLFLNRRELQMSDEVAAAEVAAGELAVAGANNAGDLSAETLPSEIISAEAQPDIAAEVYTPDEAPAEHKIADFAIETVSAAKQPKQPTNLRYLDTELLAADDLLVQSIVNNGTLEEASASEEISTELTANSEHSDISGYTDESREAQHIATVASAESLPSDSLKIADVQSDATLTELFDDLLDYAHKHRATEPDKAIAAYQKAIDNYSSDSYAPFVIIELATLYRDLGDYHAASETLMSGANLPAIENDVFMQEEFARITTYLDVVYDILERYQKPTLPYADIPPYIMEDIESATQAGLEG